MEFTYDDKKKKKAEFIEWTEKDINTEFEVYLQRHLTSRSITPSEVERVEVVVGGDHGDTAFQLGASVYIYLTDEQIIQFELSVCEIICRKDTGKLIESTILPRLTKGLKILATWHLSIENNVKGEIECKFIQTSSPNSLTIDMYVTGDLAFQAMALGKESMAGWWCMLCKSSKNQFMDVPGELWSMEEYDRCGKIAESNINDKPKLGVKQRPWWSFIPLTHYVSPLLHCEIGIGNVIFELLRDIINCFIEKYAPGEESIRASVPVLKQIIAITAKQRDDWDASPDGLKWKSLKRTTASHEKRQKRQKLIVVLKDDEQQAVSYNSNMIKLVQLQKVRDGIVKKLEKARSKLTDQQTKLTEMRKSKVGQQDSIETKVFKVLKEVGVELSSYHGGSLNGKDIKKVMNNATHIFDKFATIFKEGKRVDCQMTNTDIDQICLHFREVYVLWDGAFSLARTINPTLQEAETYQSFVSAAVQGSQILQCPITPKVHTMLRHVQWQMINIKGGLGNKMEDWVEHQHQFLKAERQQFRTVQDPLVRALAREKAASRNTHPDVLAQVDAVNRGNKRKFLVPKVDKLFTKRKRQREEGRMEAMQYFDKINKIKLTWADVIFNDEKMDVSSENGKIVGDSEDMVERREFDDAF
jgi:hypothetical protein